jgi:hypothetical protein
LAHRLRAGLTRFFVRLAITNIIHGQGAKFVLMDEIFCLVRDKAAWRRRPDSETSTALEVLRISRFSGGVPHVGWARGAKRPEPPAPPLSSGAPSRILMRLQTRGQPLGPLGAARAYMVASSPRRRAEMRASVIVSVAVFLVSAASERQTMPPAGMIRRGLRFPAPPDRKTVDEPEVCLAAAGHKGNEGRRASF